MAGMDARIRRLLESLTLRTRLILIGSAAVAAVVLNLAMQVAMQPAVDDAPFGIVDFEFASTPERAGEILDAWGSDGRDGAATAIALDYGFLIAYSALLALGTGSISLAADARGWNRTARAGRRLVILAPVAGVLDAIENTALLNVLGAHQAGEISEVATLIAESTAAPKFAIVIVGFLYIVIAGLLLARRRVGERSFG